MECNMKRPLSIALAAALVASTLAMSAAPTAAQGVEFGVTARSGEWHDNWDRDDWRWRHGHRRHHVAPGFYFNFGIPHPRYSYYRPRHRDCFRDWDGTLVCRRY
jgi:Ni/Co efflux regulator RcnB